MLTCDAAVITGSGFYDFPDLKNSREVEIVTPFGEVQALCGIYQFNGFAYRFD